MCLAQGVAYIAGTHWNGIINKEETWGKSSCFYAVMIQNVTSHLSVLEVEYLGKIITYVIGFTNPNFKVTEDGFRVGIYFR